MSWHELNNTNGTCSISRAIVCHLNALCTRHIYLKFDFYLANEFCRLHGLKMISAIIISEEKNCAQCARFRYKANSCLPSFLWQPWRNFLDLKCCNLWKEKKKGEAYHKYTLRFTLSRQSGIIISCQISVCVRFDYGIFDCSVCLCMPVCSRAKKNWKKKKWKKMKYLYMRYIRTIYNKLLSWFMNKWHFFSIIVACT